MLPFLVTQTYREGRERKGEKAEREKAKKRQIKDEIKLDKNIGEPMVIRTISD